MMLRTHFGTPRKERTSGILFILELGGEKRRKNEVMEMEKNDRDRTLLPPLAKNFPSFPRQERKGGRGVLKKKKKRVSPTF